MSSYTPSTIRSEWDIEDGVVTTLHEANILAPENGWLE